MKTPSIRPHHVAVIIALLFVALFAYVRFHSQEHDRKFGQFLIEHKCRRPNITAIAWDAYECDVGALTKQDIDLMIIN